MGKSWEKIIVGRGCKIFRQNFAVSSFLHPTLLHHINRTYPRFSQVFDVDIDDDVERMGSLIKFDTGAFKSIHTWVTPEIADHI